MENAREQMELLLRELSDAIGVDIALDDVNGSTFMYRDMVMNLSLLPESGNVLLWTVIGRLEHDGNAPARVHWMLEQHDGGVGTKGCTFMLDRNNDAVLVGDRRALVELETADHLALWIETVFRVAREAFITFEHDFPYADDEMFDEDVEDEDADGEVAEDEGIEGEGAEAEADDGEVR